MFISLNPDSPIDNKSPYVKDCTCFSDPATESGRFGGGGVGVFIDGGVHDTGAKSMVFDAFTHVASDGAGYILDKGEIAEIVSCFTYYAKWGYYSGGGSRIRGVGGNNSYGDFGSVAVGIDIRSRDFDAKKIVRLIENKKKKNDISVQHTDVLIG